MKPKVFVSIGSVATPSQTATSESIVLALEEAGLLPQRMMPDEYDKSRPLQGVQQVMQGCSGAVVIAFARYSSALLDTTGEGVEGVSDAYLPTPWSHIEGAMAYTSGIPLLVVVEEGLRRDGVLEEGYDWQVHYCRFQSGGLQESCFSDKLEAWKELVVAHHQRTAGVREDDVAAIASAVG